MNEDSTACPSPEVASAQAEAQYRQLQPKYEKLAAEVEYVINDALLEERIPIASVSRRVKTLTSFAEKIRRKNYTEPLSEVTDLAGVRIVSYFQGDLARLERMIRRQFDVREKVDKVAEMEIDQFGYRAIQYVICLRESYLGARYDDIKNLKCEIQTRAVLADAWAVLNHHLGYKKESTIPRESLRNMNSLSAVIETVEAQFEAIRQEIELHGENAKQLSSDELLNQPINPSTVGAFIERVAPGIEASDKEFAVTRICSFINQAHYKAISDIDDVIRRTKRAMEALKKDTAVFPGQYVLYALAFADPSMRTGMADWFEALFKRHRHLIDPA